ncbi:archease [Amycolatopsis pigmentata]|uniref:Archease n=1 Tax=Amycolatopsis pigmentata TaxID=450801 RepID=A0ABW5FRK2_9PSEU
MTTRDAGRISRARGGDGRRAPVHRADLRIEAWGPTREACFAEAVRALVDSFVRRTLPVPASTVSYEVIGAGDAALLVSVLGEVITRIRRRNEVPVVTEVTATPGGVLLRCEVLDTGAVLSSGVLPKGISRPRARIGPTENGWFCSVRVDV